MTCIRDFRLLFEKGYIVGYILIYVPFSEKGVCTRTHKPQLPLPCVGLNLHHVFMPETSKEGF